MTARYRLLPAADRDLDDQAAYLADQASLETALRFYDAARATFERVAQTPGLGEPRESGNARLVGLRVWRIGGFTNHLICYRPTGDGIDIVRVLHGAHDIDHILGQASDSEEAPGKSGK